MLYRDIYSLIIPNLPRRDIAAFTATCSEFYNIFWELFDCRENNYLPLRQAVMRNAPTSVQWMLEVIRARSQEPIPATVLKLALLQKNTEIVHLLLKSDTEVDEVYVALTIEFMQPELCGAVLAAAKRQVLCSRHLVNFMFCTENASAREMATEIRASKQYLTLNVNHNQRLGFGTSNFPELQLYLRPAEKYTKRYHSKSWERELRSLGIDPLLPIVDIIQRLNTEKKKLQAIWKDGGFNPYMLIKGPEPEVKDPEIIPPPGRHVDSIFMSRMVKGGKEAILKIISTWEVEVFCRPLYFAQAPRETQKLMLETGFVKLDNEIFGYLYRDKPFDILLPYWLKGKGLPTPTILHHHLQHFWLYDIATTVISYWEDTRK